METLDRSTTATLLSNGDAVAAFAADFQGDVLRPGDAAYDDARRVWNGMIDRRPALIARCTSEADVVACVRFARRYGVPFTVRGGGHNVAGSAVCDDGLVIDLAPMNGIDVDPDARRAVAQAGVTLGELDRATQPFGLAAPLGVVTETGIAGLTLGGGLGWQRRKHGLSCDALRAVHVVTADGRLLRADATENADLFWAVRGGGGNFGIVTRFEYELYTIGPDVFFLAVAYAIADAPRVMRYMSEYMDRAPEAFSPIGVLGHVPAADAFPQPHHGAPFLMLVGPYAGPVEEGERALAPLRRLATPIADLSGVTSFLEVQQFFDEDYPSGARYYWKSSNLASLGDDAIDQLIALNDDAPSPHSTVDVWFQGGAMSRVEPTETAFGDRSAPYLLGVEANWHDAADDDANIAWVRRCIATMAPYAAEGLYLNFPGFLEEGDALLETTYGANYARLVALKQTYDPDNVFRTHQNINPQGRMLRTKSR